MILQALNTYYERLAADPNEDIAPFGSSRQKISFCIVLEPDGQLRDFEQVVSEVRKGKSFPQRLVVPGQSKPPGAGINPCFLWDNATYLLGLTPEGHDSQWATKRFEAFRDRHIATEDDIHDPHFAAVCRFLANWQPQRATEFPQLREIARSFGVFRLRGQREYVHRRANVLAWWKKQTAGDSEEVSGVCLLTGKQQPLARLHEPKIKGVFEAQSSGALLVSFDKSSFRSYGKSQSYNAPVSQLATFQYATALNHLLANRRRRVQIGDATTVFWTERPSPAERIVPSLFARMPKPSETEDQVELDRVRAFLNRLRQGKPDDMANTLGDPATPYYILGLSPNAARVSVRFWLTGTLGQLVDNLSAHVQRLEIAGLDEKPPTIHELLRETASPKQGFPDTSKIPKPLSSGLMRAVITGLPYPAALYNAICRRIRTEQFVNREKRKDWRRAMTVRAAVLKACLIRNFGKEIHVALDPDRTEPAYQLGRWFALLEKIQKDQPGGKKLNKTIKDRFYTAASSTPAMVFPRVIQLSQHHLAKIESTGLRIKREKQVQEIAGCLDHFPRRLRLEDQGFFHLGYYHQVKHLYTPKSDDSDTETPETESE